jgi:hypothetical protein
MHGVLAIKRAILAQLKLFLSIAAVLTRRVVLALALGTLERDELHSSLLGHFSIPLTPFGG